MWEMQNDGKRGFFGLGLYDFSNNVRTFSLFLDETPEKNFGIRKTKNLVYRYA